MADGELSGSPGHTIQSEQIIDIAIPQGSNFSSSLDLTHLRTHQKFQIPLQGSQTRFSTKVTTHLLGDVTGTSRCVLISPACEVLWEEEMLFVL